MIELRKIDTDNWEDIIGLSVRDEQKNFVASNLRSLAEAYAELNDDIVPILFGIYNGDTAVGFTYINYWGDDDEEPYYHMCRLMIDKNHQGKGFGKLAMLKIIEHIKTFPQGPATAMYLGIETENEFGGKFYRSFGFEEVGINEHGEVNLRLQL